MKSVEEALKLIQSHLPTWQLSQATLASVNSGTTAHDIVADRDYPPFHRVMMDGIAVSWNAYAEGQKEFAIAGVCAAGAKQIELNDPRTCFEVMTGAPLPVRCDLVIPYEDLKIEDGLATVVSATQRERMQFVHLKGSDAKLGDVLLKKGSSLNGPHWGIASSVGVSQISVSNQPRINIISSGDELVEVTETPLEHQIRRSNAYALKASLELRGYRDVVLSHLPDDVEATEKHYNENASKFDLMIYSGGVSKGKFDYLPATWKKLGIKEIFHGIAQRPGKPLWFGVDEKNHTAIFGLPGNPVSSLVCLHKYFLSKNETYAQLADDIIFKKDLTYFVPVKIESTRNGILRAHPLVLQNSGEFAGLAGSDGFIELPRDGSHFKAGEAFLFHSWGTM